MMSKVVGFVVLLIGLLGPAGTRPAEANCVLTTGGGVKCWGANLGDGTLNTSSTPVDVPGLTSGVIQITQSFGHTCVLTAAGGVKCWGLNRNGQLGNGTATSEPPFIIPTPVDVVGLSSGVVQISAGSFHTCAVTTTHNLKCWGRNGFGELGNGAPGSFETAPVDAHLITDVSQVNAAGNFTCALNTSGGVKCWGFNASGELGDDSVTQLPPFFNPMPVDVVGLTSGVVQISGKGSYTCALTSAGAVKCWGDNLVGQIGTRNSNPFFFDVPRDIPTLTSGVAAISSGGNHNCVVTTSGGAKCWGQNLAGEVGNGTFQFAIACCSVDPPDDVIGLTSGVAQISLLGRTSCALTTGGGVKCWGINNAGQLGNGTTTPGTFGGIATPVDVVGLSSGVVALWDSKPISLAPPMTLSGFYAPVEMAGVLNSRKGGSTVPIRFEVFQRSTELTDPSIVVQPLTATQAPCSRSPVDNIELEATGGTTLRYD
jgi:alpha-tubulin suppressor-like RCC1 family protein